MGFSLVDPDNRRPVDFRRRIVLLEELQRKEAVDPSRLLEELLSHWQDGRIKLYLTYRALHFRRAHHEVLAGGEHIPLEASGDSAKHVCAFARQKGDRWVLVAVPRLLTRLSAAGELPLGRKVWKEDVLVLPQGAPLIWEDGLTGMQVEAAQGSGDLPLRCVFARFPGAFLSSRSDNGGSWQSQGSAYRDS